MLLRFGQRDILLRYRQTAIGVVWVVLQPLLAAGIFTIVFGQVAALPSDGVPYFLFSFTGMVAWTFLSNLVTRASGSWSPTRRWSPRCSSRAPSSRCRRSCRSLLDLAVAMALGVVLLVVLPASTRGGSVLLAPWWMLQFALLGAGLGTRVLRPRRSSTAT